MDLVTATESPIDVTPGTPPPETAGHRPVLLHSLIENLQPRPGQTVVDGTLGAGGVTAALLDGVMPDGHVVAVDRDPAAVARARDRFASYGDAVTIAGLWDEWKDKTTGETMKSCTMIITEANKWVSEVHDRMPVILEPGQFEPWLSGTAGVEMLKPAADDVLQLWPVSKRVNSSRASDDDPTLIDRIELPSAALILPRWPRSRRQTLYDEDAN